MKITIFSSIFLVLVILPVYAQTMSNPTFLLQTIEIESNEFNKMARDTVNVDLGLEHTSSWQITLDNNLIYGNPNGNAVVRFFDVSIPEKFIEIGMGSPPDDKYWIAVNMPKPGYVVVHSKPERGWIPGAVSILAYTDKAGFTVNNGERIVLSNLDLEGFQVGSYAVYGMESSSDPPAIAAGTLTVEFMSGDPSQNPLNLFPFFLAGGVGTLVVILLITKKRA